MPPAPGDTSPGRRDTPMSPGSAADSAAHGNNQVAENTPSGISGNSQSRFRGLLMGSHSRGAMMDALRGYDMRAPRPEPTTRAHLFGAPFPGVLRA